MVIPEDLKGSQIGGLVAALVWNPYGPWLIMRFGLMSVTHESLSLGSSPRVGLGSVI